MTEPFRYRADPVFYWTQALADGFPNESAEIRKAKHDHVYWALGILLLEAAENMKNPPVGFKDAAKQLRAIASIYRKLKAGAAFPDHAAELADAAKRGFAALRGGDKDPFDFLDDQAVTVRLPTQQSPMASVVCVDGRTNEMWFADTPDGKRIKVGPRGVAILQKLIEAKKDGDGNQYVTGAELLDLAGCRGMNVSREVKSLKKIATRLNQLIRSDHVHGYWLDG